MSGIEPWVFNNVSLGHLASVKIIQWSWSHLKIGDDIKNMFVDISQPLIVTGIDQLPMRIQMKIRPATHKCIDLIDTLRLPRSIKDHLSFYAWEMYEQAFRWLVWILLDVSGGRDPSLTEKMSYFACNIFWNDIGQLDGKKIVESYVSDKESIDYHTWAQLCYYCSENYIRKFADTVDWAKSNFRCDYALFWYKKIYGVVPTRDIFPNSSVFWNSDIFCRIQTHNDKAFNRLVIRRIVRSGSLSAFKYFWRNLSKDDRLECCEDFDFTNANSEIMVYVLGERGFDYMPENLQRINRDWGTGDDWGIDDPWYGLMGFPWVLFVDSWIHGYENKNENRFIRFFAYLIWNYRKEKYDIVEFIRRRDRGHLRLKYYVPYERVWTLCCEKFGRMNKMLPRIVKMIFGTTDVALCALAMEGLSDFRKKCL